MVIGILRPPSRFGLGVLKCNDISLASSSFGLWEGDCENGSSNKWLSFIISSSDLSGFSRIFSFFKLAISLFFSSSLDSKTCFSFSNIYFICSRSNSNLAFIVSSSFLKFDYFSLYLASFWIIVDHNCDYIFLWLISSFSSSMWSPSSSVSCRSYRFVL